MKQYDYYTVIFAVSRAIGCVAGLVWDRALNMPIERPGSIDFDWIQKKYGKKWWTFSKYIHFFIIYQLLNFIII